jgi:hypothetical protein
MQVIFTTSESWQYLFAYMPHQEEFTPDLWHASSSNQTGDTRSLLDHNHLVFPSQLEMPENSVVLVGLGVSNFVKLSPIGD